MTLQMWLRSWASERAKHSKIDFLHHMQKQINEHLEMVQESFKKYEPA